MSNYLDTLLVSPKRIKESGLLNVNVDDGEISASIRTAQSIYLADVVGEDLIQRLQELVYNKITDGTDKINSEANIAYATFLYDYLTDAIVFKTIIDLCMRLSFKVRNMGVVQNEDDNVKQATTGDNLKFQSYLETMYNQHLNRIADFLCKNKAAIPESKFDCKCHPTRKYANVNIWLG